ncbi:LytR family transcriptional regulator [Leptolyngbya sp. 'hensonii']|nr:LytR family transcriptional regulator [Leptolyngbya sp. 'hensonii']
MPAPGGNPLPSKGLIWARWLFWGFAFALTTTLSVTIGATIALLTPLSPKLIPWEKQRTMPDVWRTGFQYRVARPINVLVMGVDRVPEAANDPALIFSGRSDTMLLLHLEPKEGTVSILSIPRDTQVEIPGLGVDKINSANAAGGAPLAARVVSRTLNNLPIDRYVRVSTEAFRELVDLLGGVDVYVPRPMSYVDNTQKLKIDLAQGWQTLNGSQAEQFARFRQDELGDIGRIQRQQVLIKALRERLLSPGVVPKIPEMIRLLSRYIDTNLTLEELLALANFGLKLEQGDLKMVLLPGRFSAPGEFVASYWILNEKGRDRVLEKYFKASSQNQLLADETLRNLRIAIQNASGKPKMSSQVADYLQSKGFTNVYVIQDWPDRLRQTLVIPQQGDLDGATALQRYLSLGVVEADSTGDLESDITIRIGQDWANAP